MKRIVVMAIALAIVSIGAGSMPVSAATTSKATTGKKVAVATATATKAAEKPAPVVVTVVEGDSLSSIADAHATTWVRIFNANENIVNPDVINPGDQVRIPTADEQLTDRALPQPVVATVSTQQTTTVSASTRTAAATTTSYPVDSNSAKAFIYSRESGNNPNATNPNGCYGIGQDCNGVVRSQCGADYACQDQYFTSYAMRRYGSWENALAFWQSHHWW